MARAVLEGVAYELNMSIDAMQRVLGRPFDVIRLSGGGAKSPLWRQIQADVYGVPSKSSRSSIAVSSAPLPWRNGCGHLWQR